MLEKSNKLFYKKSAMIRNQTPEDNDKLIIKRYTMGDINKETLRKYRQIFEMTADIRGDDEITYDGTWENNLFNFFTKVTPKLAEDLKSHLNLKVEYSV